jgi:hypothetical protein
MSRECQLLLLGCAPAPSESDDARLQTLAREGVDWNQVLSLASRHAVLPLLCSRLLRTCREIVSREVLEEFQSQWRENVGRNLFLISELTRILALLEANGIEAVPFKGPALSALVYGNISLRQFADLDIFLHRDDIPLAKNLLLSQGYRPEIALPEPQEAAYLGSQYHYVLIDVAREVMVELHWEFTPRYLHFPLASTGLWDRLERRNLSGIEVCNFSPEDLLLILCTHGTEHFWGRLGWVCDVAQLICREAMAWDRVFDTAEKLGCQRMLSLGLFLASDLVGASLPAKISARQQSDPAVVWLAQLVRKSLFGQANFLVDFFQNNFFQVGVRGLWREKIGYCFYLPFTPTISDWECISLPARLSFLYSFLRPLRLMIKYLSKFKAKSGPDFGLDQ